MFFDFLEDCLAVWYMTWWVMIDPDAPIEEEDAMSGGNIFR